MIQVKVIEEQNSDKFAKELEFMIRNQWVDNKRVYEIIKTDKFVVSNQETWVYIAVLIIEHIDK